MKTFEDLLNADPAIKHEKIDYSKDIERWKNEIVKAASILVAELNKPSYKGRKKQIECYKHIIWFNQKAIDHPMWGKTQEALARSVYGVGLTWDDNPTGYQGSSFSLKLED